MGKHIRILTVFFDAEINSREITLFRGAVLKSVGKKVNMLYHNHTSDNTFRYSYPLIQYKRLGGKAAIVCIEEGTDVIGQYMSAASGVINLRDREVKCDISKVLPIRILVQTWNNPFRYQLKRWLPLNSKNYQLYRMTENENDKSILLEKILKGNLLSMLKGLGIYLEDELIVKIVQLSNPYVIYNKGIRLIAFDADFTCNLSIPNNIGIGKNASIGCGIIHQKKNI